MPRTQIIKVIKMAKIKNKNQKKAKRKELKEFLIGKKHGLTVHFEVSESF